MYDFYDKPVKPKDYKRARNQVIAIYDDIPETTGCMENIHDGAKCGGWCCAFQSPSMYYIEFLHIWNKIKQTWEKDKIIALVKSAIKQHFSGKTSNGCILWNMDNLLCTIHKERPIACFHPDTHVFTLNGPKKISTILAGDSVLTSDGTYNIVEATYSRMWSGALFGIAPQGSNIYSWATNDHKFAVSRRIAKNDRNSIQWISADALIMKAKRKEGDYLTFPVYKCSGRNDCSSIKTIDFVAGLEINNRLFPFTANCPQNREQQSLPKSFEIDDDFLFVVGIYLAEGYASSQSVSFHMNSNERSYLERIGRFCDLHSIRWHWQKSKRPSNLVLRVDSCLFARMMKYIGGSLSENKKINEQLYCRFSPNQLFKIFEAYSIGDGRKSDKSVKYSTSSISLSLTVQMMQILLDNGIYARIRECYKAIDNRISYEVVVNHSSMPGWIPKRGQGAKIANEDGIILCPLREIKTRQYCGPVVDLQVSKNSNFVTTSGLVHNCRIYGQEPDDEFKPKYERLKILYENDPTANIKEQCNLVKSKSPPTKKQIDLWYEQMELAETDVGIAKSQINDGFNGSYRTFKDHLLLQISEPHLLVLINNLRISKDNEKQVELLNNFDLPALLEGFIHL